MTVADVLAQVQDVRRTSRGWIARCPAHDDRRPSLSIAEGDDRRVLLRCFAGCTFAEIVAAIGGPRLAAAPGPLPGPRRGRRFWARVHAEALAIAARQRWARPDVRHAYATADAIRADRRHVARLRHVATVMGECPAAWGLLDLAAELERDVLVRDADGGA